MADREHNNQPEGLKLGDVYFVLFRQKWLILFFCVVGVGAGLWMLAANPPTYQSQAELFIRYVVQGKSLSAPGNEQNTRPLSDQEQSIINTEVQILKSFDLAHQVVEAVGAERILAAVDGGGTNLDRAAHVVMKNLTIDATKGSVIPLTFEHPDKEIAQEVLNKVIHIYYTKHAEAHQSVGVFGDFLQEETKRLQDQLADTERQLRGAKRQAGIDSPGLTSVNDAKTAYGDQLSKIRMDLFNAEAELAGHQAVLDQATNAPDVVATATNIAPQLAPDVIRAYRSVCVRLDGFTKREQELQFSFKDGSDLVKEVQQLIVENEELKKKMERDYPQLTTLGIVLAGSLDQPAVNLAALAAETAQARSLKTKINVLKSQFHEVQAEAGKLDEMEGTIVDLQRKKDIEDADLRYFSSNLEQANIDEALGTGKAPNIGVIDPPTPPVRARSKAFMKQFGMVTAGPIAAGFALAFLIELFLDTSVKRPSDVKKKLRMRLFISIPEMKKNGRQPTARVSGKDALLLKDSRRGGGESPTKNGRVEVAVWEATDPLRRFYEGLRDRLIVHFEVTKLVHKPKLVAVTSCGQGAGVTRVAAGLAASLSETGDGKVLFVDMNTEQPGASQLFYKGKPGCGLEDALEAETKESALVQENLYVASQSGPDNNLPRVLPKRFAQLLPKFRASDYDYIIFDMPPVSQTTVTPRLAGLMDMVLLVVESEKTKAEVVQHASSLLAESQANVGVVLNKTKTYVPAMLHQELLDEG
jgi:succinoglycan biosynthesis transport protein ExoP